MQEQAPQTAGEASGDIFTSNHTESPRLLHIDLIHSRVGSSLGITISVEPDQALQGLFHGPPRSFVGCGTEIIHQQNPVFILVD